MNSTQNKPAPAPAQQEQPNVTSYLASNWFAGFERPPAVILNPQAHYLELLAWCWSEVQSLLASADVCIIGGQSLSTGDLSAIFLSRLEPLDKVMTVAITAAMCERSEREAAAAVKAAAHV